MVTTATYNQLIPTLPTPPPNQSTLNLFSTYDHPFPGVQSPAPAFTVNSLISQSSTVSVTQQIELFINDIVPKLRPNTYAPCATVQISVEQTPNVQSSVLNFYSVDNNNTYDALPPTSANAINAALTNLEQTFNQSALSYLLSVFTAHAADIVDNPHHDSTFYNLFNDFYQLLYTQYLAAGVGSLTLSQFTNSRSQLFYTAIVSSFQGLPIPIADMTQVVVPADIFATVFSWHTNGTDSTIHANSLQALLFIDPVVPNSLLQITPYTGAGPTTIPDGFPRLNGSIFIQALLSTSNTAAMNVVTFAGVYSPVNTILIGKNAGSYALYVEVTFNNNSYTSTLTNIGASVFIAFTFSNTGFVVTYLDNTGTQQQITQAISNFFLDLDQVQLSVPLGLTTTSSPNTIQQIITYPSVLSSSAITTLFTNPLI